MLDLAKKIISILTSSSAVTTIVPAANIFTGPVDLTVETQASQLMPRIDISVVSEVFRTVPLNTRDTRVQFDIWSRTSELEVYSAYEAVVTALNYTIADQGSTHIFWDRVGGATEQFEGDRRIWHLSVDFVFWSQ